jgi:hypothetical protein
MQLGLAVCSYLHPKSSKALRAAVFVGVLASSAASVAMAEPPHGGDCPKAPPTVPAIGRTDVYKDSPFKAGEAATYVLTWSGLKAGYATLEVRAPRRHNGSWHRVFHIDAATGDWFQSIFVAKESMEAVSRPWDFGVSQFYMEQNEGHMFGHTFQQKKWLSFDHDRCNVHERIQVPEKQEENVDHELAYGANDALGVVYNLRTRSFAMGRKERALVYTSEKNWFLEAEPVAMEQVTVPAGTYNTVKLKLQTYIGKDLQQKGDVWAWIATDTPQHELVQVRGEIKIGSVWIRLSSYNPGSSGS